MKTLPAGLQQHLDSGATTLAWCWRLTRRDGVVLGFTDHDLPVYFDGTVFEAATAFEASEMTGSIGLSVDDLDVASALRSDSLNEDDLAAGLFDDARVEIFRVNWSDPVQRVLMRAGSIGEVRRAGAAFNAEIRGLAHYLQQPRGRQIQRNCDAVLGDARCGVDLSSAAFTTQLAVTGIRAPTVVTVSLSQTFASGWFTAGALTWTTGGNAGRVFEIKRHWREDQITAVELWQPPSRPVVVGDAATVTAGCDKSPETCGAKFANIVRFRGFPHVPGMDFVTSYPSREDVDNDGGSRFTGA